MIGNDSNILIVPQQDRDTFFFHISSRKSNVNYNTYRDNFPDIDSEGNGCKYLSTDSKNIMHSISSNLI